MLLKRLAIGMLAAALCFGAAAQQAQNGEQLVNNHEIALRLQAEKNWSALLTHLDMWESEGGQDPIIFEMRTEALRETGEISAAIETMKALQKETPESQRARHAEILRALGELQTQEGDFDSAEKSYRRSLAISETALAWRQLAGLLAQKTPINAEDADAAWRKTLSYGQYINESDLWQNYAEFRDTLGDPKQTYKAFEHVVRLLPGDVAAWQRLFMLADELGKKKAQRVIVARLERIDANEPLANVYLGMKAHERGDKRMANYHYAIAVQSSDDEFFAKWRALAFLGLARNAGGREEALAFYRESLLADPSLSAAWESAIVTLRRMRRFKDARVYAEIFFQVRQYLAEGRALPDNLLAGI